ncbi:MAG: carbon monoxide dehydrogenase [Deltaproteobacteria bacterium]|nr:MAG: carbon monoxide dehydrogenase [Deltaproteobacteria bacterium]
MKLAVSGKGGVGKTTFAALVARHLAQEGMKVLAVDADPVPSLAQALGIEQQVEPIANMHELIHERTGAQPGTFGGFFKMNPRVDDIPERFSARKGNIRLIVMGTVDHGGSGCVCPESVLLKNLVQHIVLYRDEALVMDMEAGVEHLGRATAKAVDKMIVVVEPGGRSLEAAKRIKQLATEIGLRNVVAVANKVRGEGDMKLIREALGDIPLMGGMEYDQAFVEADLSGKPPFADGVPEKLRPLLDSVAGQGV